MSGFENIGMETLEFYFVLSETGRKAVQFICTRVLEIIWGITPGVILGVMSLAQGS